jgi:steroid 5-alpha reductase family enzyme
MESSRTVIAALLFIVAVVGINYAMFIVARTWAKGGDSRWMSALRDSLSKPTESSANKSMDELRNKMNELENNKKEE